MLLNSTYRTERLHNLENGRHWLTPAATPTTNAVLKRFKNVSTFLNALSRRYFCKLRVKPDNIIEERLTHMLRPYTRCRYHMHTNCFVFGEGWHELLTDKNCAADGRSKRMAFWLTKLNQPIWAWFTCTSPPRFLPVLTWLPHWPGREKIDGEREWDNVLGLVLGRWSVLGTSSDDNQRSGNCKEK